MATARLARPHAAGGSHDRHSAVADNTMRYVMVMADDSARAKYYYVMIVESGSCLTDRDIYIILL